MCTETCSIAIPLLPNIFWGSFASVFLVILLSFICIYGLGKRTQVVSERCVPLRLLIDPAHLRLLRKLVQGLCDRCGSMRSFADLMCWTTLNYYSYREFRTCITVITHTGSVLWGDIIERIRPWFSGFSTHFRKELVRNYFSWIINLALKSI